MDDWVGLWTWLGMLVAALLVFPSCQSEAQESGTYQLPEPTEENRQRLIEWTREHMVFVNGGTFMFGDVGLPDSLSGVTFADAGKPWAGDLDARPAHMVKLTPYSIQKYEVTYAEYDLFTQLTGREPIYEIGLGTPKRSGNRPVFLSTWAEARAYCQWIGEQIGTRMDLPTEAQWEYAARSRGRSVAVATDDGLPRPGKNMIYSTRLKPIGTYPPNPLGLYNMSDNAREWTLNWYDEDWYEHQAALDSVPVDPVGPPSGTKKVTRGGFVGETPRMSRLYRRKEQDPNAAHTGFRCVANRDEPIRLE